MVLTIISIILLVAYCSLILYFRAAWAEIPDFMAADTKADTTVSIIIPARNEEENIGKLLAILQDQSYPFNLVEIIVIDDHSTDQTSAIVKGFPTVKLISLEENNINSYKKKAIETGISKATGEWIICTDADCIPTRQWVETLMAFRQQHDSVFIAAPVVLNGNGSFAGLFQVIDFMVLQGITGAGVTTNNLSMCNGANLAYSKKCFGQVNGFTGIDEIASGDDMLLMNKMQQVMPAQVHYLKSREAIVETTVMPSWSTFLNQRIRWASKSRFYTDRKLKLVLILVYGFNLLFGALAIAAFFSLYYLYVLIAALLIKTTVEYSFVVILSKFFRRKISYLEFLLFQPLHIIYIVVSGFFSQIGTYEWKGRKVK